MNYLIIDEYRDQDYTTLVVEKIDDVRELTCLGEFSLNLLNSDEVGLDPIIDANFVEHIKNKEIFFCEIKNKYLDIILDKLKAKNSINMYIKQF